MNYRDLWRRHPVHACVLALWAVHMLIWMFLVVSHPTRLPDETHTVARGGKTVNYAPGKQFTFKYYWHPAALKYVEYGYLVNLGFVAYIVVSGMVYMVRSERAG